MPLYEYECEACAERFERIQKFSDPPVAVCPSCGGPVKKLLSSPAIQFKGAGWYITDYARKGASAESKSSADKPSDSGGSGSDKGADTSRAASGSSPKPDKPATPSGD